MKSLEINRPGIQVLWNGQTQVPILPLYLGAEESWASPSLSVLLRQLGMVRPRMTRAITNNHTVCTAPWTSHGSNLSGICLLTCCKYYVRCDMLSTLPYTLWKRSYCQGFMTLCGWKGDSSHCVFVEDQKASLVSIQQLHGQPIPFCPALDLLSDAALWYTPLASGMKGSD